jgi:hypothetical protein
MNPDRHGGGAGLLGGGSDHHQYLKNPGALVPA